MLSKHAESAGRGGFGMFHDLQLPCPRHHSGLSLLLVECCSLLVVAALVLPQEVPVKLAKVIK